MEFVPSNESFETRSSGPAVASIDRVSDAIDLFLTDLEHVVDEIFDLTRCIDPTDVRTMPADQNTSKCYDPTAEEYYYGYGCTIGDS